MDSPKKVGQLSGPRKQIPAGVTVEVTTRSNLANTLNDAYGTINNVIQDLLARSAGGRFSSEDAKTFRAMIQSLSDLRSEDRRAKQELSEKGLTDEDFLAIANAIVKDGEK